MIVSKKWSPFKEGDFYPDRYKFFFERDKLAEIEDPQDTEDLLEKLHPNNYCYVWVRTSLNGPQYYIINLLIGMPEEAAMIIRLRSGLEVFDLNTVEISNDPYIADGSRTMYLKENNN